MPRHRTITTVIALAAVVAATAPAHAFRSEVSGKNLAYLADRPINPSTYPPQTLRIAKGKKGHVVRIDVTVNSFVGNSLAGVSSLTVNGLHAHPKATVDLNSLYVEWPLGLTPGYPAISLDAVYWLDLDAAENESPGSFYGQPLDITVTLNSGFVSGPSCSLTVTAEMKKK